MSTNFADLFKLYESTTPTGMVYNTLAGLPLKNSTLKEAIKSRLIRYDYAVAGTVPEPGGEPISYPSLKFTPDTAFATPAPLTFCSDTMNLSYVWTLKTGDVKLVKALDPLVWELWQIMRFAGMEVLADLTYLEHKFVSDCRVTSIQVGLLDVEKSPRDLEGWTSSFNVSVTINTGKGLLYNDIMSRMTL